MDFSIFCVILSYNLLCSHSKITKASHSQYYFHLIIIIILLFGPSRIALYSNDCILKIIRITKTTLSCNISIRNTLKRLDTLETAIQCGKGEEKKLYMTYTNPFNHCSSSGLGNCCFITKVCLLFQRIFSLCLTLTP